MRIIAFGDIHMSLGNFMNIPGIDRADLVIITGDLTNFGQRKDAAAIIETIKEVNTNLLALAGNLDHKGVDDYLTEKGLNLHGTGKNINRVGIFGIGGSNPTPFNTPIEFPEEELARLLNAGFERVKNAEILILVSHAPPFKTNTDRINSGHHVGSLAVRSFIEEKQPDLCLTGHIHEAKAEDRIGKTLIINPGMIKDGGWIEINIENKKIKATLRTESAK